MKRPPTFVFSSSMKWGLLVFFALYIGHAEGKFFRLFTFIHGFGTNPGLSVLYTHQLLLGVLLDLYGICSFPLLRVYQKAQI